MAAQFRKLSFYLRTMWKGHMGIRLVKKVDPLDLPIDSELDRRFLVLNKLIYRLGAVARSIELCDEWARNSFAQFRNGSLVRRAATVAAARALSAQWKSSSAQVG
jgi:hypothetical protein